MKGLVRGESVANRCRPTVIPEWTDYNDHFNVAYYARAFDLAFETFLSGAIGGDALTVPVKAKVDYLQEVAGGRALETTTQVLGVSETEVHVLQAMYDATSGDLAAIQERIDRFVGSQPEGYPALTASEQRHAGLSVPEGWGALGNSG